ncbi:MAG: ribonuclease J [Erysipelotrichaceae bacterium]|nr:ribonuclease J [Erysipelotrichaceae bacterium]MDO5085685.1 ribonuclease J [Erysipelotrichaceae bacterium]
MEQVRIFALGGLDEDGKNMYVIEVNQELFVVEAGLKYPSSEEQLGVEIIIPDFKYLIENKERIKGVFITHGHDDVMAALPYLLKQVDVPVYATELTALLIEKDLKKEKVNKKINRIKRNGKIKVGSITVESFGVTQSIPDGVGLAFHTKHGAIVYTSEFIVDYDVRNEAFMCDIASLAQIGKAGVLALLTESVGATREGYTSPHHKITSIVEDCFEVAEGRILVTLYKQNLFRIIEVLELCKKFNKKVMFYDQKQLDLLKMVSKLGYYKFDEKDLISSQEFSKYDKEVVCIVSGSGNEVFKLMQKIAIKEDDIVELSKEDTVIIASPVVPGTERYASNMENDLYKEGVRVVKVNAKEVFSMHASIEELKMILYLFKPKYYIPVKGEYRHLVANANIALNMGYRPDKIVVLDNGQISLFADGKLKSTKEFLTLEETLIDGNEKLDVGGMVLKDRETLSTDGVIVVGVVINHRTKEIIGGPDVQSRGVIYLKDADYIVKQLADILIDTIEENTKNNTYDNMQARLEAKEKMVKYMIKETGKRPMILLAIVEINIDE